jgi:pimeloyl-ACP methyl ester carboxylesterase
MEAKYFQTNDGVRLKYTDDGSVDAPALVLLHGWSANGRRAALVALCLPGPIESRSAATFDTTFPSSRKSFG